jgi:hypothetical protein
VLAAAEDGEGVADFLDFVELVRDEDDRGVLLGDQGFEGGEEFGGFGGGEDGGGFVEDEDGILGGVLDGEEGFEDFDALLFADGEGFDFDVEGDLPLELGGEGGGAGAGFSDGGVGGEGEVFEGGEGGDEFEVLVDHADAEGLGDARGGDFDGFLVEGNGAGVGLEEAEEDVHEGGFAGAVFPEESVDFVGLVGEGDVGEGGGADEGFGDVF